MKAKQGKRYSAETKRGKQSKALLRFTVATKGCTNLVMQKRRKQGGESKVILLRRTQTVTAKSMTIAFTI